MDKKKASSLTNCRMMHEVCVIEILGLSDHTQTVLTSYIDVVGVVDSKFHQTK